MFANLQRGGGRETDSAVVADTISTVTTTASADSREYATH
jgi:hypothetical protein